MSAATLEAARDGDAGVAETVRQALERQARAFAWKRLAALGGKVAFDKSWQGLRGKDDDA